MLARGCQHSVAGWICVSLLESLGGYPPFLEGYPSADISIHAMSTRDSEAELAARREHTTDFYYNLLQLSPGS